MTRGGRFAGAHCLVIGGSSGLGRAVSQHVSNLGGDVTIGARDPARGEAAAKEIGARYFEVDATSPAAVAAFVENATAAAGPPRLLVAIGGGGGLASGRIGDTPLDSLDTAWRNYYSSRILPTAAVAPQMRGRGYGKIVLVSTEAGRVPGRTQWLAGSVAAGLFFAVRSLAADLASDGVRINAVALTLVAGSPTYERLAGGEMGDQVSSTLRRIEDKAPLGLPNEDQVVNTIGFLLGPESDGITGQIVSLNGGM